jgi:hypothetical protein
MSIDYSACAIPKGPSRAAVKQRGRAEDARVRRELKAYVAEREGYRCRVCGTFTNPRGRGLMQMAHLHHIEYRSQGGMDTKENTCLLDYRCHSDIHGEPWKPPTLRVRGDAEARDETGRLCGLKIERRQESRWEVVRMNG